VCAAVELREREDLSLPELTSWLQPQIAPYKIPRELRCVASLPRNAMGKVLKPDVTTLFLASGDQAIG
jgi:malonyl-CoA/methylmalonyl-CoA synthetase